MTTSEATKHLGRVWYLGGCCDVAEKINICIAQSRAWNWTAANAAMQAAYRLLGAEAPEVPINAIHKGEHPVQIACAEMESAK